MRVNWKRFWLVFAILQVACFAVGCSASWIGAVNALLPALEAAISAALSFVAALEGKTVPASVSEAIQKIGADISTELANVKTILAAATGAVSTGVVSEIQAAFQAVQANLASILSGLSVTDSATVTKLTQLVGVAVAAVQAILGLVPMMIARLSGPPMSEAELRSADKLASQSVNHIHAGLKDAYKVVVSTKTAQAQVDAALESLPKSLP